MLSGKAILRIFFRAYRYIKKQNNIIIIHLFKQKQFVYYLICTCHVFKDGDLPVSLWDHGVSCHLPAVRLCALGSPDVRRPPDPGQQPGGATHRVVTGPGGLLVPGFDWLTGQEQRHSDTHHGEPHRPLHAWDRLGTSPFTHGKKTRLLRFDFWLL